MKIDVLLWFVCHLFSGTKVCAVLDVLVGEITRSHWVFFFGGEAHEKSLILKTIDVN